MSKLIQKIRAVIYNVNEGRLLKEEGYKEIEELMDIHNQLNKRGFIKC